MKTKQLKSKSTKRLLIFTLIALMIVGTIGGSYAYWDSLQDNDAIALAVGEGTVLSIEVSSKNTDGKTLVPYGVLMNSNDINAATFNYDIELTKVAAVPATLSVTVVANSVKIGGSDTYADLVKITITADNTITETAQFTVTVEFDREPDDAEAYNAVKNATITFDILVEAAVV